MPREPRLGNPPAGSAPEIQGSPEFVAIVNKLVNTSYSLNPQAPGY